MGRIRNDADKDCQHIIQIMTFLGPNILNVLYSSFFVQVPVNTVITGSGCCGSGLVFGPDQTLKIDAERTGILFSGYEKSVFTLRPPGVR